MNQLFWLLWRALVGLWKTGVLLVFLVMLALNIATLTIDVLSRAASAAIYAVSGIRTVASAAASAASDAVQSLGTARAERDAARAATAEAKAAAKVEREAAERATTVTFRGKQRPIKEVAEEVSRTVSKRTAKVAVTNIGSMAGEGIPLIGIAVIVAATTFEVAQACDTARDMYDLQVALDPSTAIPEDREKVCGLKVPTGAEIWAEIKASPSAVWEATRSALDGISLPDLSPNVDWFVAPFRWVGDQFE